MAKLWKVPLLLASLAVATWYPSGLARAADLQELSDLRWGMTESEVKRAFPGKLRNDQADLSTRGRYLGLYVPDYLLAGCRYLLGFWFSEANKRLLYFELGLVSTLSESVPITKRMTIEDFELLLGCADRAENFLLSNFGKPNDKQSSNESSTLKYVYTWYRNDNEIRFSLNYVGLLRSGFLGISVYAQGVREELLKNP
jgi:hypothetical protein